jgi:hypothetical protein
MMRLTHTVRGWVLGLALLFGGAGGLAGAATSGAAERGHAASVRLPTALAGPGPVYEVRPKSIYFTGDDSGVIGVLRRSMGQTGPGSGYLHWAIWNRAEARGTATLWVKLSTPVGTSPFTRLRAGVLLRVPRDGHFTLLELQYRLHGQIVNEDNCVPARGKVAEWGMLMGGQCV